MPIWTFAIYEESTDFEASRRGVIRAPDYGIAAQIASQEMGAAQRVDLTQSIVRDETKFRDGFTEFPVFK